MPRLRVLKLRYFLIAERCQVIAWGANPRNSYANEISPTHRSAAERPSDAWG
jgi:hypothetical protein